METVFLREIECPVCLLTPRQPPIYLCPLGHSVCYECRPKIRKCPICKVNYLRGRDTRNFFAEKVLDSLSRKCRYELFDCEFSACDSKELVDHEEACDRKPKNNVSNQKEQTEDSEGEIVEIEELRPHNDVNDNDPIFLNLIYFYDIRPLFHFYAVSTVFLRIFLAEFGDIKKHPGISYELIFVGLLLVWMLARVIKIVRQFMEVYQPDEFETQFVVLRNHLRNILYQDAKEVYLGLVVWTMLVVLGLASLKLWVMHHADYEEELAAARFQAIMFFSKPAITFTTSVVCIALHLFFKRGKLEKWAAVFGVFRLLWLSFNLAFVELSLNTGSLIDTGYSMIFWIQAVTVFLPYGKVSFILLELFGFGIMTYNAYDTLFLAGNGKHEVIDTFYRAFVPNHLASQFRLKGLRANLHALAAGLSYFDSMFKDVNISDTYNQYVDRFMDEL